MIEPLLVLLITILIFIGLRKIIWRYWGIDEMIKIQRKQTLYLECLIKQNGELPKVMVREVASGEVKEISVDGWVDLQLEFPNKFQRVHG